MKKTKDIHQLAMDLVKVAQDQQKGMICIVIDPEKNGASIARTPAQDDDAYHAFQILKHLHPAFCKLVLGSLQELPQWQTGPIPEPTGFSIVLIEQIDYIKNLFHYSDIKAIRSNTKWEWLVNPNKWILDANCTGRWCIQPINLPGADGIGEE